MSRNGSGTYVTTDGTLTGPNVATQQKAAGVKVTASRFDATIEDIATALTNSIAVDGQSTITADIPFNSKKITGLGAATAITDAARVDQVQKGSYIWGGTSGGSANAQTLTLTPALAAYEDGLTIRFRAGTSATGAATLNVNGLGAITIKKNYSGSDLAAGDLDANVIFEVVYFSGVFPGVFRLLGGASMGANTDIDSLTATNELYLASAGAGVTIRVGSFDLWRFNNLTGGIDQDASNGGDITLNKAGTALKYAAIGSYTPTIVAPIGGTVTSVSNNTGSWQRVGAYIEFHLEMSIITNSSGITGFRLLAPASGVATPTLASGRFPCYFYSVTSSGAGKAPVGLWRYDGTDIRVDFFDGSAAGATENIVIMIDGKYRAV